jgi:hypothetical protein
MIAHECLEGYIGIPDCGDVLPESGIYITDHPGLSKVMFDKIAGAERQTWHEVWKAIERRAINRMMGDVTAWFGRRYKIRNPMQAQALPRTVTGVEAGSGESGIRIDLGTDDWYYSSLQVIHFQNIDFFSVVSDVSVTFYITDINNEINLYTKTITVAEGWNTVFSDVTVGALNVKVWFNAAGMDVGLIPVKDDLVCFSCCEAKMSGISNGNSYGISGRVAIHCSFEKLICNNKAIFKNALWNAMAYEAMRERIYSERLNRYTLVDRDIARNEMAPEFLAEYQRELAQAVDAIDISDPCCIECDAQVRNEWATL